MRMSMQQQKYVSLTVSAVSDLMNDTLRALGRTDGGVERDEVMRALRLGLDEIELLWCELRSRAEDLKGNGDSLADFFEFAPDAYLITQGDGTICQANRLAAELMETSSSALCDRRLHEFVPQEERGILAQRLRSLNGEQDGAWHAWWGTIHFRDGSDLDVEFRVRRFHPPFGGAQLYFWLLRTPR
jgi:PAS domain S-box-containing protein